MTWTYAAPLVLLGMMAFALLRIAVALEQIRDEIRKGGES